MSNIKTYFCNTIENSISTEENENKSKQKTNKNKSRKSNRKTLDIINDTDTNLIKTNPEQKNLIPSSLKDNNKIKLKNSKEILHSNGVLSECLNNSDIKNSIKTNKNVDNDDKNNEKPNAFQLLMNARNRSIGSNSSGIEIQEEANIKDEGSKQIIGQRKKLLQEWAEQKGGRKRKQNDQLREEYINNEMNKRAKRLKKMLNGNGATNNTNSTSEKLLIDKKRENKTAKSKRIRKSNSFDIELSCLELQSTSSEPTKTSTPNISKRKKNKKENIQKNDKNNTLEHENDLNKAEENRTTRKSKYSRHITDCNDKDLNFLEKLSSPIKKRDSLLGYFSKILSPEAFQSQKPNEFLTEKLNYHNTINEEVKSSKNDQSMNKTNSGRPKRSCTGKVCYNYDKQLSSLQNKTDISLEKSINEIIISDDSIENNETNRPKKIAPVFTRTMPKPAIDSDLIEARNQFLMSGIPDKMKIEITKQKLFVQDYDYVEIFPKISHINQLNEEKLSQKQNSKNYFRQKNETNYIIEINRKFCLGQLQCVDNVLPKLEKLLPIENKYFIIKHFKNIYGKFPTYKCYNQLKNKYRTFSGRNNDVIEQITETFVVTRNRTKKELNNSKTIDNKKAPNGELLFTEKYKPSCLDQLIVNIQPVKKLKEFLSLWQNENQEYFNDSINDFANINNSNSSLLNDYKFIILYGPSSVGKTNAVFALANEMNFSIIEINAGMKRTGKRLLQDLQEATQSHRVNKNNNSHKSLKKSINLNKYNKIDDDSLSSSDINLKKKLSLILIEDADIIFEQDPGFIDAIHQLASTSKRPVIIIANNPNCSHLIKLKNQNSIEFPLPNVLNISKFLSILTIVENCPIDLDDIIKLYLYNRNNIRKTLLEIQFYIQSGGDRLPLTPIEISSKNTTKTTNILNIHKNLYNFYTIEQNIKNNFYLTSNFNVIYENLTFWLKSGMNSNKEENINIYKKIEKLNNNLVSLIHFYENISSARYIARDEQIDRIQPNLHEEILNELVIGAIELNIKEKFNNVNNSFSKISPNSKNISSFLPVTVMRSKRSQNLDYEPCLRSICRSEMHRSLDDRRSSRFYHYLRNSININTFSTELFDKVCSIFSE